MKNKNHKNRKTIRLQTWDYRWAGAYFITICTHKREHYFGEIMGGKMQLSHVGVIADILWYEIENRVKNVALGEFVVMPNHIHGILILNDSTVGTLHATPPQNQEPTVRSLHATTPQNDNVRSLHATTPQNDAKNEYMSSISPKAHSVSTIIRSYKSAVSKHAKRLGFEFAWQARFHDHIIRNEKSFDTISKYIINNSVKWEDDRFFLKEAPKQP
jgi:REP element-mobilizing transposase RayT